MTQAWFTIRRPNPIETPDIHILICLHRLRDVDYTQESRLENASQVADASIKVTHGKKYEPTLRLIKTFLINERQLLHMITFKFALKAQQSNLIKQNSTIWPGQQNENRDLNTADINTNTFIPHCDFVLFLFKILAVFLNNYQFEVWNLMWRQVKQGKKSTQVKVVF